MAKKIPRLKHLDSIFLLEKYCQEENILEAENLMDKLKRSKINVCFDKILNYFELLVKKDRIDGNKKINIDEIHCLLKMLIFLKIKLIK